jgi:hypothetical protein
MKKYQKLGAVLTIVISGSAAAEAAVPVTLYNNIPATLEGVYDQLDGRGLTGTSFIANKFSTGELCPAGCILGDITLNLSDAYARGSSVGYKLEVVSDNSDAPGITLATYNNPAAISSSFGNDVFTPGGAYTLAANTNYWVKLSSTIDALIYWDNIPSPPGQSNHFIYNLGGENYTNYPGSPNFLMTVQATSIGGVVVPPPATVPVPGAVWMMGSALIGLVTTWRKKSR